MGYIIVQMQEWIVVMFVCWMVENELFVLVWILLEFNVFDVFGCVVGQVDIMDIQIIEINIDEIVWSIY